MKIKPWSISTTVRNPERIRNFLFVLKKIEGLKWESNIQKQYQILLLQNRIFGVGSSQFYKNLSEEDINLLESEKEISYEQAEKISNKKAYTGGLEMRGRQSFNPLRKMGLAYEDQNKIIKISPMGKYFLKDDYDLGEVFFKSFIKWQLPNPTDTQFTEEHYNVKPFVATLHLINEVNKLCSLENEKPKGISRLEFTLFALTLFSYEKIKEQAQNLIKFRHAYSLAENKECFVDEYINKNFKNIETKNLQDYSDNAIRYFRLTRYVYLRGKGNYVDLEPRRKIEIDALLEYDNAKPQEFNNRNTYLEYVGDINLPKLPWENRKKTIEIINDIEEDINKLTFSYSLSDIVSYKKQDSDNLSYNGLKDYASYLRKYRQELQFKIEHNNSQMEDVIKKCKSELLNILHSKEKKSVELERLSTLALNALDDANEIKPNYPVGDDNRPTFTAPSNKPDIECFYSNFNAICEVTMLTSRDQWFNEGQPVMRHLRDFEDTHSNVPSYCLFIAPKIHRDTINTYWMANKFEYEGKQQRIIPLTIEQFSTLLDILLSRKKNNSKLYSRELKVLYDNILSTIKQCSNSIQWQQEIPNVIKQWQSEIVQN